MNVVYSPKYNVYYRVNPRDPKELQWSPNVMGPATRWQHAYTFNKDIRALDIDEEPGNDSGACVVILNEGSTYLGKGARSFARKFYAAGSRIYKMYKI